MLEQGAFEDYFTTYSKISIISTVLLKKSYLNEQQEAKEYTNY